MFREQIINFLSAVIVFLLRVNVVSAVVALYALRLARSGTAAPKSYVERRIDAAVKTTL